jgi:hypothetical protein
MINLTFSVDDLDTVLLLFNRIRVRRYIDRASTDTPDTPVTNAMAIADYTTFLGTDAAQQVVGVTQS